MTIEDLDRPLPDWQPGDEPTSEEEIIRRGVLVDRMPDMLDDLWQLVTSSQGFFSEDNLNLLERWSRDDGSPFNGGLVCRRSDGEFLLRSITFDGHHFFKGEIARGTLKFPSLLSSVVRELRKPSSRH